MSQRIENTETRIRKLDDLIVWQKARDLNKSIYRLTGSFPNHEQYILTSQMRRSSLSICSNIAEGFGRIQYRDKEHFYVMALGSISELLNQMIISKDLGYSDETIYKETYNKLIATQKILNALITTHRKRHTF